MKHEFKQRIIYRDTDAEGVVYYANYLGFFERGRTELLKQIGISLKELKEKEKIVFAICRVECDYVAPARYDDELTVVSEVEKVTPVRIIFSQKVLREGEMLVSARITGCAIKVDDFKPARVPAAAMSKLKV